MLTPLELDLSGLSCALGNDQIRIGTALRLFVKTTEEDLKRLTAALELCDSSAANMAAHRIKGAAQMIGAIDLVNAAQAIEDATNGLTVTPRRIADLSRLPKSFDMIAAYIAAAFPIPNG